MDDDCNGESGTESCDDAGPFVTLTWSHLKINNFKKEIANFNWNFSAADAQDQSSWFCYMCGNKNMSVDDKCVCCKQESGKVDFHGENRGNVLADKSKTNSEKIIKSRPGYANSGCKNAINNKNNNQINFGPNNMNNNKVVNTGTTDNKINNNNNRNISSNDGRSMQPLSPSPKPELTSSSTQTQSLIFPIISSQSNSFQDSSSVFPESSSLNSKAMSSSKMFCEYEIIYRNADDNPFTDPDQLPYFNQPPDPNNKDLTPTSYFSFFIYVSITCQLSMFISTSHSTEMKKKNFYLKVGCKCALDNPYVPTGLSRPIRDGKCSTEWKFDDIHRDADLHLVAFLLYHLTFIGLHIDGYQSVEAEDSVYNGQKKLRVDYKNMKEENMLLLTFDMKDTEEEINNLDSWMNEGLMKLGKVKQRIRVFPDPSPL
ncbi:hypothetical protein HELRODRAFT_174747 [Helobdella robusta]|uniref:RanBP2-type domain-containing protein n=1 Tax=Helobdella robusta TaxID=6412 RepID=T1F8F4_HELRO|nr:hypothetical protein HELRODRAFT_174747 [Helobdella robusta]ESO01763.1 hypothetical protein HELRODRAFT_174747 [Helobdella robusta]